MSAGAARIQAMRVAGGLVVCGSLLALGCTNAASGNRFADWRELHLEGGAGLVFSGRVELSLSEAPGARVLETRTTARVLGATVASSSTRTVVDAATGRTRSYEQYSSRRGRRYSFAGDRYSVERLVPAPDAGSWEIGSREEFRYPLEDGAPVAVHDYYGMLLRLRELGLERPGDTATFHVATSGGPRRFVVSGAERRTREREFEDLATGAPQKRELRELRLRLAPDDPAAEEGFLRMEGETEVWVEARSKAPLEISGKIPDVPGRVKLELAAMD
jgi:hypothetical protein